MSTGRIRNYGLSAMRAAGIPDKYTCHATRHAAESLLLDAGVPERDVARQARHNKGVMQSTYHHPSDFDHTQRAKALREHVSDVNPQELLACALTPLPRSQRHFTPLRDAGEPTSWSHRTQLVPSWVVWWWPLEAQIKRAEAREGHHPPQVCSYSHESCSDTREYFC